MKAMTTLHCGLLWHIQRFFHICCKAHMLLWQKTFVGVSLKFIWTFGHNLTNVFMFTGVVASDTFFFTSVFIWTIQCINILWTFLGIMSISLYYFYGLFKHIATIILWIYLSQIFWCYTVYLLGRTCLCFTTTLSKLKVFKLEFTSTLEKHYLPLAQMHGLPDSKNSSKIC